MPVLLAALNKQSLAMIFAISWKCYQFINYNFLNPPFNQSYYLTKFKPGWKYS
jgi:hypothetical protein